MGYYINQRAGQFCIKKKNFAAALAAIKALALNTKAMGGGSSTGEKWYSWVNTAEFVNAKTLDEALGAWRWGPGFDKKTGDLTSLSFDGEKLGDDEILLDAIAPYVEPESFIEIEGEDGALWRWKFDGKTMTQVNAEISWPE